VTGIAIIVIGIASIFMLFAVNGFAGSLHHRGMRPDGKICGSYIRNRHRFNNTYHRHRTCKLCDMMEEETVTYDGHWYWIVDPKYQSRMEA
jgi:hypothetical protein